jgi:hypothetical protein
MNIAGPFWQVIAGRGVLFMSLTPLPARPALKVVVTDSLSIFYLLNRCAEYTPLA